MEDNALIYSDQTETIRFRVKDIKQLLETHTHLPVIELRLLDKSRLEAALLAELYPTFQPDLAWYFEASFQTSEGDKACEVVIGLKDQALHLINQLRPVLKVFKEQDRKRAKEGIPDVTLAYIQQLEQVSTTAWCIWKQLYEHVSGHMADPKLQGLKGMMRSFYDEYEKVGMLLPDNDQREDAEPQH